VKLLEFSTVIDAVLLAQEIDEVVLGFVEGLHLSLVHLPNSQFNNLRQKK